MGDHATRAKAALDHAYQLIREAHESRKSDGEVYRVACLLAASRGGFHPDEIVAFVPVNDPGARVLLDSSGAAAYAMPAGSMTMVPAWTLFEADARSAIDVVNSPALSKQDAQSRALSKAVDLLSRPPADRFRL